MSAILGRLASRFRRRPAGRTFAVPYPEFYPPRLREENQPAVFADDLDGPWPPADEPWNFTAPAEHMAPGPGELAAYYAAEDIRRQQIETVEHSGWWGETRLDLPVAHRPAPFVPEPAPAAVAAEVGPASELESAPVSYPPLSYLADFRDLPVFRQTARLRGHAPAGLVRDGDTLPALPDFALTRFDAQPDEVAA